MSRLTCTCGHDIVDQTDCVAEKAYLLRDVDREAAFASVAEPIAARLQCRDAADLDHWKSTHPDLARFNGGADLVWHLLSLFCVNWLRDAYECSGCGRLYVQAATASRHFRTFDPDEAASKILRN